MDSRGSAEGGQNGLHKISPNRHKMRIIRHGMPAFRPGVLIIDKESTGAAFGRAPQGRGAPLWMLSLSSTSILALSTCIPRLIMCILCLFGLIPWIAMMIPSLSLLGTFPQLVKFGRFGISIFF